MNGADLLVQTALANSIDVCLSNPGTTEMPIVQAIGRVRAMRGVLFLFEGGATGAADGYARMSGRPAMTLLHLGPGFANGMANLHNARRGRTPIVNVIGDHATWHVHTDPPLHMDIPAAAGAVSGWVGAVSSPTSIAGDFAAAVAAARHGQSASLSVPHDFQLADVVNVEPVRANHRYAPVDVRTVEEAARLLRSKPRTALILGGRTLLEPGLAAVAAIRAATGCDAYAESFAPRLERGAGRPDVPRVPYFPNQALETLGQYDGFVYVGARRPTAFFGWPGAPSYFVRDDQPAVTLQGDNQDESAVIQALAQALDAGPAPAPAAAPALPGMPTGVLDADTVGAVVANLQPEGAIVVNESISTGQPYLQFSSAAPPFTMLNITGGAIGGGIPMATGAALACPNRPVINLQADGSAMYTLQTLWTQAREGLDVTTLICSNRRYKILDIELLRAGVTNPTPAVANMVSLDDPALDWTRLAQGMGVPAVAVDNGADLAAALQRALAEPGPHLIDMQLVE